MRVWRETVTHQTDISTCVHMTSHLSDDITRIKSFSVVDCLLERCDRMLVTAEPLPPSSPAHHRRRCHRLVNRTTHTDRLPAHLKSQQPVDTVVVFQVVSSGPVGVKSVIHLISRCLWLFIAQQDRGGSRFSAVAHISCSCFINIRLCSDTSSQTVDGLSVSSTVS